MDCSREVHSSPLGRPVPLELEPPSSRHIKGSSRDISSWLVRRANLNASQHRRHARHRHVRAGSDGANTHKIAARTPELDCKSALLVKCAIARKQDNIQVS